MPTLSQLLVYCCVLFADGARSCIQISQLPAKMSLEGDWAYRKVSLKATPTHACWYPEAHLLALTLVRQVLATRNGAVITTMH